eukprot:scaffold8097_cov258-Pinguiococcus_pyrenoidosus.AAC.8
MHGETHLARLPWADSLLGSARRLPLGVGRLRQNRHAHVLSLPRKQPIAAAAAAAGRAAGLC